MPSKHNEKDYYRYLKLDIFKIHTIHSNVFSTKKPIFRINYLFWCKMILINGILISLLHPTSCTNLNCTLRLTGRGQFKVFLRNYLSITRILTMRISRCSSETETSQVLVKIILIISGEWCNAGGNTRLSKNFFKSCSIIKVMTELG